jgi:hypothetical protein
MTQKDLLEGKRILIVDDEPVTEDHYSAKFLLTPPWEAMVARYE